MLTANKNFRNAKRSVRFVQKASLQPQKVPTKGQPRFEKSGAFDNENKKFRSFCKKPGSLQRDTGALALVPVRLDLNSSDVVAGLAKSNFGHHPMTTALAATSSYRTTKTIHNSRSTMMSNDALNAFFQGLVDEDGSLLGDEDDVVDDDGAVNDDKLEEYVARQEAADERKRNLLSTLMNIVELEDQEQREFDAVDLRRHREIFRGLHRKKGERGSVSVFVTQPPEGCVECVQN